MLLPYEKLKEWAATLDSESSSIVLKFLAESEAKMTKEVEAAKECLRKYGYKTYEDQKHKYHEM